MNVLKIVGVLSISVAFAVVPVMGDPIYHEDFSVDATESIMAGDSYIAPSATTGWDYYGRNGASVDATGFMRSYTTKSYGVAMVKEGVAPIDSSLDGLTFSADLALNVSANIKGRLLVEIDSQWYASPADTTITAIYDNNTWQTFNWAFDPAKENWQEVALAKSTAVVKTPGTTDTDLSGMITGFGIFHDRVPVNSAGTLYMDSFTVVPEPATLGLIGLSGLLLLVMRRVQFSD